MAKTKVAPVATQSKAVVKAKRAAPPVAQDDDLDLASEIGSAAGAGMEGADRDAFAIPFLRVLQNGSPQVMEGNAAFVKGAKPGMLFNTVTQETYSGKDGVIFLPCAYQRRFIQWGPRDAGGGFKAEVLPEVVAERRASGEYQELDGQLYATAKEPNPKKDDKITDTRNHFGILITDGKIEQVLLSLSSTQIKKSKQLMGVLSAARIKGAIPPTWANRIKITTALESNDKGSWFGVRFEADGFIESRKLYEAGKAFYELVRAGTPKVEYVAPDPADASATADDGESF